MKNQKLTSPIIDAVLLEIPLVAIKTLRLHSVCKHWFGQFLLLCLADTQELLQIGWETSMNCHHQASSQMLREV